MTYYLYDTIDRLYLVSDDINSIEKQMEIMLGQKCYVSVKDINEGKIFENQLKVTTSLIKDKNTVRYYQE